MAGQFLNNIDCYVSHENLNCKLVKIESVGTELIYHLKITDVLVDLNKWDYVELKTKKFELTKWTEYSKGFEGKQIVSYSFKNGKCMSISSSLFGMCVPAPIELYYDKNISALFILYSGLLEKLPKMSYLNLN